jgi:hypothetical protein
MERLLWRRLMFACLTISMEIEASESLEIKCEHYLEVFEGNIRDIKILDDLHLASAVE